MTPLFATRAILFLQVASAFSIVRRGPKKNFLSPNTKLYSSIGALDETVATASVSPERLFREIDLDENGMISFDELDLHLSNSGYVDRLGWIVRPIFERMDLDSDGQLSLEELVAGTKQYIPACKDDVMMFVNNAFEDVTRLLQSATAHGDGTISRDTLRDHLLIRVQDDEYQTDAPTNAVDNLLSLLDDNGKDKVTQHDITSAFVRFYALQEALSGLVDAVN